MRKVAVLSSLSLALGLGACSRHFESDALGLRWTPPKGIGFLGEVRRAHALQAQFEGGVSWFMLDGPAPTLDESTLESTLREAMKSASPFEGTLVSSRLGIAGGRAAARYELLRPNPSVPGIQLPGLAYVIPRSSGTLLLRADLSIPRGPMLTIADLDQSMSTLDLR
jgi:hypothetical protein